MTFTFKPHVPVFLLIPLVLMSVASGDSPQFRGVNGWGVAGGEPIPNEWNSEKNIAWKVALPGSGWSAPIVLGDKLFVTSAVADGELQPKNFADGVKTPQSMGLGFLSSAPDVNVQWTVFCLDRNLGTVLWKNVIETAKPKFAIHPSNSYATETPVADEDGVYVYFGAAGKVAGLTHAGDLRWVKDVGVFRTSNSFGTGSSLAIHRGKVYLQNFSEGSADLYCLDTKTGDVRWKNSRDKNGTSWSSPLLWENSQRNELIISGGNQVDSFDPDTGSQLWTIRNVKAATACSVCADQKRIYFGGSDPFSSGPLFAVGNGGTGDLTPDKKNGKFEHCAWLTKSAAPGMASPVSSGEYVYVAEKNILRCYSSSTGERLYQQRLPKMKMVNSSPLIVGNQLLLIGEGGNACVVQTGPEFKVLGSGNLEDTFWSTPAISEGVIYLRGLQTLYCIRTAQ